MFDLIPFNGRERSIWNYWDNLEKSFFQNMFPNGGQLRTDIVDEGGQFVLHAELPGFQKEDIKVDLDGNYLTVSAAHSAENEENKDNYVRRERRMGSYSRSFDVSDIRAQEITAKYDNGVLTLVLPKKEAAVAESARRIEIQ